MSEVGGDRVADRAGALWHPFADMHAVQADELLVDRAEGVWLHDADGRRYLDASAGLWYCNVGHGRGELAEAAARQLRRLAGYQIFDRFTYRPARALAQRICELVPMGRGSAAFFTSGGSDAIDTAAKIARRYWAVRGEPDRRVIVAREGAYHGVNAFGTSLAGLEANAAGWGPLVTEVIHVPATTWRRSSTRSPPIPGRWPRSSASRCRAPRGCTRRLSTTGQRSATCAASTTCC